MGILFSSLSTESDLTKVEEIAHREEVRKRGVLIPPSFGVLESTLASSTTSRLPLHPSLLDDLSVRDVSNRLLHDYMIPGLWLSTQVDSSTDIRAAFVGTSVGRIVAERRFGLASTRLLMGTEVPPTVSATLQVLPIGHLIASLDTEGQGWIGSHLEGSIPTTQKKNSPPNNMQIRLGSWVPIQLRQPTMERIHGYASFDFRNSTAAVQVHCPLDTLTPSTRSYFCMSLTDQANNASPLIVAVERTEHSNSSTRTTSAVSLSQILSFNRFQTNPMEDRAPYVRQTAAWTIRMERTDDTGNDDNPSQTTLALGGAWQLNRALAVKAVLRQDSLTTAVLWKRWIHPRAMCSVLFRHDRDWKTQFVGFGIEVDTGSHHLGNVDYSDFLNRSDNDKDVPKTKTAL